MITHPNAILLTSLVFVFAGMLGFQLLGHRLEVRRAAHEPFVVCDGTSAIEATLFALLGLLVAFTLAGAQERLDVRRRLIADEANVVSTAYLRIDLLPEAAQPRLRDDFRQYTDARIAFYEQLFDPPAATAIRQRSIELQLQIWRDALPAARQTEDTAAKMLLLSALNEMIDITTTRDQAMRTHVPVVILVMLVVLAFACALFAGIGMAKNSRVSRLHVIVFAGVMAVIAYVILNVEFPRAGFVRLGSADALLTEVRESMGR